MIGTFSINACMYICMCVSIYIKFIYVCLYNFSNKRLKEILIKFICEWSIVPFNVENCTLMKFIYSLNSG